MVGKKTLFLLMLFALIFVGCFGSGGPAGNRDVSEIVEIYEEENVNTEITETASDSNSDFGFENNKCLVSLISNVSSVIPSAESIKGVEEIGTGLEIFSDLKIAFGWMRMENYLRDYFGKIGQVLALPPEFSKAVVIKTSNGEIYVYQIRLPIYNIGENSRAKGSVEIIKISENQFFVVANIYYEENGKLKKLDQIIFTSSDELCENSFDFENIDFNNLLGGTGSFRSASTKSDNDSFECTVCKTTVDIIETLGCVVVGVIPVVVAAVVCGGSAGTLCPAIIPFLSLIFGVVYFVCDVAVELTPSFDSGYFCRLKFDEEFNADNCFTEYEMCIPETHDFYSGCIASCLCEEYMKIKGVSYIGCSAFRAVLEGVFQINLPSFCGEIEVEENLSEETCKKICEKYKDGIADNCGDFKCDTGESGDNCCLDCKCSKGYFCQKEEKYHCVKLDWCGDFEAGNFECVEVDNPENSGINYCQDCASFVPNDCGISVFCGYDNQDHFCGECQKLETCKFGQCVVSCGIDGCEKDKGENCCTCPLDCQEEKCINGDCKTDYCGNGKCDADESYCNCPSDCPIKCGDGCCSSGETLSNCSQDCKGCGNGKCDAGETPCNCAKDCSGCCILNDCSSCGTCKEKTCTNYVCGCKAITPCCGNKSCDAGESYCNCPSDCSIKCGDGCCSSGEDCSNCEKDCGSCEKKDFSENCNGNYECFSGVCVDWTGFDGGLTCGKFCSSNSECAQSCCNVFSVTVDGEDKYICTDPQVASKYCQVLCGNGECDAGESYCNCPSDCSIKCGDGCCSSGEDCSNCEKDCGVCIKGDCCEARDASGCNNLSIETCVCKQDLYCCDEKWDSTCVNNVEGFGCGICGEILPCGNEVCDSGESYCNCSQDCEIKCGDGCCSVGEDKCNCEGDCGKHCGDGLCNCGETNSTCCQDCGGCVACGNGICDVGENPCNCAKDCKGCCISSDCSSCGTCKEKTCTNYTCGCKTITPCCGNNKCESDENCSNCEKDCGKCEVIGYQCKSCKNQLDCGNGYNCISSFCKKLCKENSDCPSGTSCTLHSPEEYGFCRHVYYECYNNEIWLFDDCEQPDMFVKKCDNGCVKWDALSGESCGDECAEKPDLFYFCIVKDISSMSNCLACLKNF